MFYRKQESRRGWSKWYSRFFVPLAQTTIVHAGMEDYKQESYFDGLESFVWNYGVMPSARELAEELSLEYDFIVDDGQAEQFLAAFKIAVKERDPFGTP